MKPEGLREHPAMDRSAHRTNQYAISRRWFRDCMHSSLHSSQTSARSSQT